MQVIIKFQRIVEDANHISFESQYRTGHQIATTVTHRIIAVVTTYSDEDPSHSPSQQKSQHKNRFDTQMVPDKYLLILSPNTYDAGSQFRSLIGPLLKEDSSTTASQETLDSNIAHSHWPEAIHGGSLYAVDFQKTMLVRIMWN